MPDSLLDVVSLVLGLVALGGAVLGWLRWVRPRWRRLRDDIVAARDTLLGRAEIRDSITNVLLADEVPSLGRRLACQEAAMDDQKQTLEYLVGKVHTIEHEVTPNDGGSIKDSVARIEDRLADGDARFDALEGRGDE